jgi:flagellar basal body-associated protein FliL
MNSIPYEFMMALMTFITVVLGAVAVIAVVNESGARRNQEKQAEIDNWNERKYMFYTDRRSIVGNLLEEGRSSNPKEISS